MDHIVHDLTELELLASKWVSQQSAPAVFLLEGEMGAGKTTFVKAICKALEINDNVSSPTFSLVNEYKNAQNDSVYHFDLYRLKDAEELYEIGFEEYLDSGSYVFIEWPEIGEAFYDSDIKRIKIEIESSGRRISFD